MTSVYVFTKNLHIPLPFRKHEVLMHAVTKQIYVYVSPSLHSDELWENETQCLYSSLSHDIFVISSSLTQKSWIDLNRFNHLFFHFQWKILL